MKAVAAALVVSGLAGIMAPAAVADVSTAKGKRICTEAAEAQNPGAKARVNSRDIRTTETTYLYQVRITDAEGNRSDATCTVVKESGEAKLTANQG